MSLTQIKNPNPQGKGLSVTIGLIQQINQLAVSPEKPVQQIADELFTSMFILHSDFQFKPVIGKDYWLYQGKNRFKLSLISPTEWQHNHFGEYIGRCELHNDLTWSLELSQQAENNPVFMTYLNQKRKHFDNKLKNAETLNDCLPGYQKSLPYYQRVFSTALAKSLGFSMHKNGIGRQNYQQALRTLIQ